MTTWIVHTAGDADLCLPGYGEEDVRLGWRAERLRQVAAAPTEQQVRRLLVTFDEWRHVDPHVAGVHFAPMASALAGYEGPPPIVLVVGTDPAGHALGTAPIADGLADAIGRVPDLFGPTVTARTVHCRDIGEEAVSCAVGAALTEAIDGDEVVVTWGSGATLVTLGILAAVTERRLAWWLLLTGRDGERHDLIPEERPARLVPWLLRLRYPDAVAELVPGRTEEPQAVIDRLVTRRRDGFLAKTDAAITALVLDSITRPDGTAGLAVRRYVDTQYRRRLEPGETDLLAWAEQELREHKRMGTRCRGCGGGHPRLGACLHHIRYCWAGNRPPSARWLLSGPIDTLNEIGKASHQLNPPTPRQLAQIEPEFTEYVDELDPARLSAGLPCFPALPGRTVLAVWPVGDGRSEPFGPDLLDRDLPDDLRAFLCADATYRKPDLHCLLLGTSGPSGSLPVAQAQVDDGHWWSDRFGKVHAEAWGIEAAGPVLATDPHEVDRQVMAWLREHDQRLVDVGAAVLVPVGAKPLHDGALLALHRWTLERGVPLYLRSYQKGVPQVSHYRLPARLAGDRILAGLARWALRRLEYDTASRLLRSGSRDLAAQADRCERLAHAFRRGRPVDLPCDAPGQGVDLAAARVELVRDRLADESLVAEQVRLVHIAYAGYEVSLDAVHRRRFGELQVPYRSARPVDLSELSKEGGVADAQRVVVAMRDLRDALPTTHGEPGVTVRLMIDHVVGERSRHRLRSGNKRPTLGELVDAFAWALRQPIWEGWPVDGEVTCLLALDRKLTRELEARAGQPLPGR